MRNRFGIKDLVLTILIVVLVTVGILQMIQGDRLWRRIDGLEARISAMDARPVQVVQAAAGGGAVASSSRDESWGRPGVDVVWSGPMVASTDPRQTPGFRAGGEVTEIFGAQPARITPYLSTDVYGQRVIDRVVEPLMALDPKTLERVGVLADAWQVDPDGLWVRCHINPRAKFADGHPVTAEDVRYTFMDFIKNPLIEAERSRALMDKVQDVVVVSDRVVDFLFTEALFTNANIMGNYILPKHVYGVLEPEQINQSTGLCVGSGQFKLPSFSMADQWTPGSDIVLVRDLQYWGDPATLDGLRFKVVTNDLASLTAFENGEGDFMTPTSPQFVNKSEEADFLESTYALNWLNMRSGYSFIGWQCGKRGGPSGQFTPFHDKRVRRAMTMILDRETMIKDIWDGIGVVATGPNGPESTAYNHEITPWLFDMEAAQALLTEAGWVDANGDGVLEYQLDDGVFPMGKRFEFEFTISTGGQIMDRIMDYIRGQCQKARIVCVPKVVDWSFFADMLKTRDFDALIMGWSANSPESDPQQIWHSSSIQDQGDNFIQWANADADELVTRGRLMMDTAERQRIWQQFHAVVHEDQPYTFLRVSPWLRFVSRSFGNVQTYKTGLEPQEWCRLGSVPEPAR
ncbi:MAG: ABC transporter substrate-binding protein [Planctomycetota bacterium]|nr:ABC transporter substrate-binding protein [Planctomycetota bacterium]